jgi:hypothetical protein
MLNFIKPSTFKWWQLAIYETALLSLGIIIGTKWPEILGSYDLLFAGIFVAGAIYVISVWLKQQG